MLKAILIGLSIIAVLVLGGAMLLPRERHVERAITIEAPTANVYALLDGYALFNTWSPWYALEPDATYAITGPAQGVGAAMSWKGKKIGEGRQEIVEATPFSSIATRLEFTGQNPAQVRFTLSPDGRGTKVRWSMDADMGAGPVGRAVGLFFDRMVGPDYERGLAGLKALAEKLPKTDVSGLVAEVVEKAPVPVAYVDATSSQEPAAIAAATAASFQKVEAFMRARGLKQAGPVITINTKWADGVYAFEAAVPVDRLLDGEVPSDSPVKLKPTYAGRVVKAVHQGAYASLPVTYDKLEAYLALRGLTSAGPAWDEYVSDPAVTQEPDLITNVYQPVQP